jgi:two-component system invasion response regulator UvrY
MKLVEEQIGARVIAETGSVSSALRRIQASHWDLVVMGLSFDRGGGLDLLQSITKQRPAVRVLVLTVHAERLHARRCFKAGAAGFVTSDSSPAELGEAIQTVLSGVRYVSPRLTEARAAASSRDVRPAAGRLSDRELDVMRLLAWGRRVDEIAALLSTTARVVRICRGRVIRKLATETAIPATRFGAVDHAALLLE